MTENIYSLIIVLGVLVFFHELGHFLMARLFGVGVEKFSLGFGPRLFGKTVGETDYRVSAIPLGGYVKMVGEDPDSEVSEEEKAVSFTHKPVWQRFIIVAAGPVFNIVLAIVIYYFLFVSLGSEGLKPIIGQVAENSPAFHAGIQVGDTVLRVNDKPVVIFDDIDDILDEAKSDEAVFTISRGGSNIVVSVKPELKTFMDVLGDESKGYYTGAKPPQRVYIESVLSKSPAKKGGLKQFDQVLSIDGVLIDKWETLVSVISKSEGKELEFRINRNKEELIYTFAPILDPNDSVYRVGIKCFESGYETLIKEIGPVEAIGKSIEKTWFISKFMIRAVIKIIAGGLPRSELGGPIMIAKMAGDQARAGIDKLISFIALISINLAILNFLPIPVLDGGHLMFFTIEAIKGSPVSSNAREIAQQIGMLLLLALMIFVFYNDLSRVFAG